MTDIMHAGQSSLVYAATDGRHRPASHPVLRRLDTPSPGTPLSATATASVVSGVSVLPGTPGLAPERIRELRVAKGMSQYDLAREMGVSRPAIAWWELSRRRPSAEHADRLLAVLA